MVRTGAADRDVATDRTLALLVGIGVFAFYLAVQRGEMVGWDGRTMAGVARSIWEHGSVTMYRDSFGVHPLWRLQFPYSEHGLGFSLVLAPLWALQLHAKGDVTDAVWLTLANPALLAATTVMVVRIGAALGWRRRTAVLAALAFALLTMAPAYSTELFGEPLITFATVLAVLGCMRWQQGRAWGPWFTGTAIGIAIVTRTDSILLLGVIVAMVPLFVRPRILLATIRSWLPALAVPVLAAIGLVAWYNDVRYGSPLTLGYGGQGFTTPLWTGLERNLLSPGKGFFWYDPILLAGVPGLWWLRRRNPALALTIVVLSVTRIGLYAKWWDTDGAVAWGPRFLLPLCPLLALGVGETLEHVASWRLTGRRVAAVTLAGLTLVSGVVVVASLWVGYDQVHGEVSTPPIGTPPAAAPRVVAQQRHDSTDSIGRSDLVRTFHDLDDAHPFPLRHFAGGPSLLGVGALTTFVACLTGALVLACAGDRHARERVDAGSDRDRDDSAAVVGATAGYETSQTGAASISVLRSPGP